MSPNGRRGLCSPAVLRPLGPAPRRARARQTWQGPAKAAGTGSSGFLSRAASPTAGARPSRGLASRAQAVAAARDARPRKQPSFLTSHRTNAFSDPSLRTFVIRLGSAAPVAHILPACPVELMSAGVAQATVGLFAGRSAPARLLTLDTALPDGRSEGTAEALAEAVPDGLTFSAEVGPGADGPRYLLPRPAFPSGAFFGHRIGHGAGHFYRAVVEGWPLAADDAVSALGARDRVTAVVRIGGGSSLWLWTRVKASVMERELRCLATPEAVALWAALLAGGLRPAAQAGETIAIA